MYIFHIHPENEKEINMARKLGNEVMMDILKEYQVEYVFGIPGATEIHFMEGIEATPEIQYILTLLPRQTFYLPQNKNHIHHPQMP